MNRRIFLITSSSMPAAQSKLGNNNTEPGLPFFFAVRIEQATQYSAKSRMNNGQVHISWQTSTEAGTSHFELQRSANGRDFDPVETIEAGGHANTISRYATTDSKYSFFNDRLYYRLKVVFTSGRVIYTDDVAMDLCRFATTSMYSAVGNRYQ